MADTIRDQTIIAAAESGAQRYMDWGAIICGALIATAISLILTTFLAGIGLSAFEPGSPDEVGFTTVAIMTALCYIFVHVGSFGVGGYIAGRMRAPAFDASSDEVAIRDGVHGLAMWALAALAGAYLATSGLNSAAGAAASAVKTTASAAMAVTEQASDVWFSQLSEEDRTEIANVIQRRTGISSQEARARVDKTFSVPSAIKNVSSDDVAKATDKAAFWASMLAFLIAATSLVAAAVAWWAADLGGHHRDTNRPLSPAWRWRD